MNASTRFAASLLKSSLKTEGRALALLDAAAEKLALRPETASLLRQAIETHFAPTAETLRDPEPATRFCSPAGEFAAEPRDGEQAPSRPVTIAPPPLSDMGFELDVEQTETAPC
jgi:hypothetical protein